MNNDAQRAKSIFFVASEIANLTERAAYLDCECGNHAALRERVEALLQVHDAAPLLHAGRHDGTNIYGAGVKTRNEGNDDPSTCDPTTPIGYEIVEQVGRGGMGV